VIVCEKWRKAMALSFIIMEAMRLGYEILTIDGKSYYRPKQKIYGPFDTLDAAAKAAINDSRKPEKLMLENENANLSHHKYVD
jgi:hypothetical protein